MATHFLAALPAFVFSAAHHCPDSIDVSADDASWGPVSACRSFDFTLRFENVVLGLVPAVCLFVLFLLRLPSLLRKPKIRDVTIKGHNDLDTGSHWDLVAGTRLGAASLSSLVAVAAIPALVGAGADSALYRALDAKTMVPQVVVQAVAMALTTFMIWKESSRTRGGSYILSTALFAMILCHGARLRTLSMLPAARSSAFLGLMAAQLGFQVILLLAESTPRRWDNVTREARATFVSRIFFLWLIPMLLKGFRTDLKAEDVDSLRPEYEALRLGRRMRSFWGRGMADGSSSIDSTEDGHLPGHHEKGSTGPQQPSDKELEASLLWTLARAFPSILLAPVPWRLIYTAAVLAQPFLVQNAIVFAQSYARGVEQPQGEPQPLANGWGLVGAFALVFLIIAISFGQYYFSIAQAGSKVRGALIELVYAKAMRLSLAQAHDVGSGTMVSLMSVDVDRISKSLDAWHELWSGILLIGIALFLLFRQIGVSFVASIVVIILCFFVVPFFSRGVGPAQQRWSASTDSRVNVTSSFLSQIKNVKMSGYERIMRRSLYPPRVTEIDNLRRFYGIISAVIMSTNLIGDILGVATYLTLAFVSRHSDPQRFSSETIFASYTLLNIIKEPVLMIGQRYTSVLTAYASIKRVEAFLLREERPSVAVPDVDDKMDPTVAVAFSKASLSWKAADDAVLRDVNVSFPQGKLSVIMGRLGSGKSTLLLSILGEANLTSGSLGAPLLRGRRIAYVSQDSWLRESATVRDNVVFGARHDAELYDKVLEACDLHEDISTLANGDKTLAKSLSGGQRQRVSLARALYAQADVLLLDDVLAALDARTAGHVTRRLFDGDEALLKGKTCIICSNSPVLVERAARLVVTEAGSVRTVDREEDSFAAARGLAEEIAVGSEAADGTEDGKATTPEVKEEATGSPSEETEKITTGTIGFGTWLLWIKSCGIYTWFIYLFADAALAGATIGSQLWLQHWSEQWSASLLPSADKPFAYYAGIYALLVVILALCFAVSFLICFLVCVPTSGKVLYEAELDGVVRAPLSFFSQSVAGQILNRFSQDLFTLDFEFPLNWYNFTNIGWLVVGSVILMCASAPYLSIVAAFLIVIYYGLVRFYTPNSRQLRRLDAAYRTPLYGLFAETTTPSGLATIRGLRVEQDQFAESRRHLDNSVRMSYTLYAVRRWLQTWLGILAMVINTSLMLLVVCLRNVSSVGLFAVALVQATALAGNLNIMVLSWTEAEIAAVALERIQALTQIPDAEDLGKALSPADDDDKDKGDMGSVEVDGLTVTYPGASAPALRDVSIGVSPGERLGICGRSGSGKSSLLMAILGLVQHDEGSVKVNAMEADGRNGQSLRENVSVVTQVPLILAASVRMNLDPDERHEDAELWMALEKTQLKDTIKAHPDQLEAVCDSTTLSTGQRQLLCLARAVLRRRPILILDECTSSLDPETERLVDSVVREVLPASTTVIAVAHRIATIRHFDRILVLDQGHIAELDTPANLLAPGPHPGIFRRLAQEQKVL